MPKAKMEVTSKVAKAAEVEENPVTAREAGGAADVSTTLPGTTMEEMTPDEANESALVIHHHLNARIIALKTEIRDKDCPPCKIKKDLDRTVGAPHRDWELFLITQQQLARKRQGLAEVRHEEKAKDLATIFREETPKQEEAEKLATTRNAESPHNTEEMPEVEAQKKAEDSIAN